jgi:hypothetical protein
VNSLEQTEFEEPVVRVNNDVNPISVKGWNEVKAWDELASYYKINYNIGH